MALKGKRGGCVESGNRTRSLPFGCVLAAAAALLACLLLLPGCQASVPASVEVAASPQESAVLLQEAPVVPSYSGSSYAVINEDVPFFTQEQLSQPGGTEVYGSLDSLGRCTGAFAVVGPETLPDDERGDISSVHPSGWQYVEYSFVDGLSLYNRCHLIAYCLTDEDANERNLVTGTRSMNLAMVDFEQQVLGYVRWSSNHVAYRATPLFTGTNLVCSGVLVEAQSIEDGGSAVRFCVYFYNVEPGVDIDYATGDNALAAQDSIMYAPDLQESSTSAQSGEASSGQAQDAAELTFVDSAADASYALNVKTGVFHLVGCKNVKAMAAKNRQYTSSSREAVLAAGYQPGGCCNP